MKLVVGLGNPGPNYAATRHNVGFRIAERFADLHGIEFCAERFSGRFGAGRAGAVEVSLLEPLTWMNLSGHAVAQALDDLDLDPREDLLVVYDDLDLPVGRIRLRASGGSGGHRGMAHIIDQLGHGDFARLRFGLGRPPLGVDPVAFVLEPFTEAEQGGLAQRIDEAARAVGDALGEGVVAAMNRHNREPESG